LKRFLNAIFGYTRLNRVRMREDFRG
jgi:hypothetical protein